MFVLSVPSKLLKEQTRVLQLPVQKRLEVFSVIHTAFTWLVMHVGDL